MPGIADRSMSVDRLVDAAALFREELTIPTRNKTFTPLKRMPGTMATPPAWQGDFRRWIREPEPAELLDFNVFFHFRRVAGDSSLAEELLRTSCARSCPPPAATRADRAGSSPQEDSIRFSRRLSLILPQDRLPKRSRHVEMESTGSYHIVWCPALLSVVKTAKANRHESCWYLRHCCVA